MNSSRLWRCPPCILGSNEELLTWLIGRALGQHAPGFNSQLLMCCGGGRNAAQQPRVCIARQQTGLEIRRSPIFRQLGVCTTPWQLPRAILHIAADISKPSILRPLLHGGRTDVQEKPDHLPPSPLYLNRYLLEPPGMKTTQNTDGESMVSCTHLHRLSTPTATRPYAYTDSALQNHCWAQPGCLHPCFFLQLHSTGLPVTSQLHSPRASSKHL